MRAEKTGRSTGEAGVESASCAELRGAGGASSAGGARYGPIAWRDDGLRAWIGTDACGACSALNASRVRSVSRGVIPAATRQRAISVHHSDRILIGIARR